MECKLKWVNFRRVSDPRRAFWPAFRVTGISDDWYRSAMAVMVMRFRTSRSAGENFGCTWKHLGAPVTSLGVPTTRLGARTTSLGAPMTSLGAPTTSLRAPMTRLGAPTTSLGAPGSTSDKPGSTSNHCRAVCEKQHFWQRCRCAWKSQLLLIVQ